MGGAGASSLGGEAGYGMGSITGETASASASGLAGDGGGSYDAPVQAIATQSTGADAGGYGGGATDTDAGETSPALVTAGYGGGSFR